MTMSNIQESLTPNGTGKPLPPLPLSYQTKVPNHQDEPQLKQLLSVLRRRALVIAGVAISVASAIALGTMKQELQYEGKFQLLVEPVTEQGDLAKLTQILGSDNTQKIRNSSLDYETQIQVLRSPSLMSGIIDEINKKYRIDDNSLLGGDKLTINRLAQTKILEVRYRDKDPDQVKFVLNQVARGYLQYSLQERQTYLKQGIQFVEANLPQLRDRVDQLQAGLQAWRQQNNIFDPESQAKQLVDWVSKIEQQQLDTQIKLTEAQSLYTNLSKQLGLSTNQAIALATLGEDPNYLQLLQQLPGVEAQIATESARFTESSPTIEALRNQRDNLVLLLQEASQKVLGKTWAEAGLSNPLATPGSIRLQLTQQLVDATNQIQILQVRQNAIASTASSLNLQVKQMAVIARRYSDFQREINGATQSLNRFLMVRENLEIEAAQNSLPWQIILKPQKPEAPIPRHIERNMIWGAIAGLLLGTAAAILIERLDNVFHSPNELKELTKLPLLGIVPYHKQLKALTPAATLAFRMSSEDSTNQKCHPPQPQCYKASPFLESFRSLQTNIRFLGSDRPIHSILISSATLGDGKSTIAVHLAQAAAAMGQRVLLVDADLRRPQVHKILGLENQVGLSDVITTEIPAIQVIQRLPMWDHLYVLTAGQQSPDPTQLLSSPKMQYLIDQFHAVFDLVIYDTPPALGVADGQLLAAKTDGVVLVAGLGRTDRSVLMQALDSLKLSKANVLGVVANCVKGYTTSSYYHYQHYYTAESDVIKAKKLLQKRIG